MELYPAGPASVPADLTKPTRKFRVRAWLAVLALLSFVFLYFGLTAWFGWTAYRLVTDGIAAGEAFWGIVKALPAAFVFAFLVRGLFAVKHAQSKASIELSPDEEPELFAFLHRIADEARAPRPRRVYLSPNVNAGVFYDLSLINLIIPSKKNLEIGLGVVSSLNLGEMKAVMGHEFGHFAQRTMAVGRWVYIGEQVAGHIVASRGIFDKALAVISSIDLRVAWIGWIMQIFIWSVRSVIDTAFRLVVLARQALSREMELQADLTAVSLTGSDALIHALHKLHAADGAFGQALGFAQSRLAKGEVVEDLYAVQTRMVESIRRITGDASHGEAPPIPAEAPERHRVFDEGFAQPPQMWSTHPPNRDREENAKRVYIAVPPDERSAWLLFRDPEKTRQRMTRHVLELMAGDEPLPDETLSVDGTLEAIDEEFSKTHLQPRYHGLYLGRPLTRHAVTADELCSPEEDAPLDELYPDDVAGEIEAWKDLEKEHSTLKALADGFLEAPGGVVRYRGEEISRRELSRVIERVDDERRAALDRLLVRDRRCRTAHLRAARELGRGWEAYLRSLIALLHYAEHAEADVIDAQGFFTNVFMIVIADGRVTDSERRRLLRAGDELYEALGAVYGARAAVGLPDAVAKRMGVASWAQHLGELGLNPPTSDNLADWLGVVEGWVQKTRSQLGHLCDVVLEVLLDTEDRIAAGGDPGEAPDPAVVPSGYPVLLTGKERERQTKLGFWDRFQLAEGWLPGTARLLAASAILGMGFLLGFVAVDRELVVFNSLGTTVTVVVDGERIVVPAAQLREVDLGDVDRVSIRTETSDGRLVEEFEGDVSNSQGQYVYNVAGAAPLVEWTAVYGGAAERPPRMLGAPRWLMTEADHVFEEPPMSVSSRSGSSTRLVLDDLSEIDPMERLATVEDEAERRAVVLAHARFDQPESVRLASWLSLARDEPELPALLEERLAAHEDVQLRRLQQDIVEGDAREAVCEEHRSLARATPGADWDYLVARCIDDPREQSAAFVAGFRNHPQHPFFARAAGSALGAAGHFEEAAQILEMARQRRSGLGAEVALDLVRLRRALAASPSAATVDDLAEESSVVQMLIAIDRREDWVMSHPAVAYVMIEDGRVPEAVRRADQDSEDAERIVRLAAASDGAPPAIVQRAFLAGPDAGIDATTVWSAIALAARENADIQPYVERARELVGDDETELMLRWADREMVADDPERERSLEGLSIALRGHARVMGIILLGEEAPNAWLREVRALLLNTERPWFSRP